MSPIRTALAVVAVAAAGFVQAQEATPMAPTAAASTLDRASVVAETRRALAADQLAWGNEGSDAFGRSVSQRDRASVSSEAAAANRLSSAELLRSRLLLGM